MAFDKKGTGNKKTGGKKPPAKVISIIGAHKGQLRPALGGGRPAGDASEAERFMNRLREKAELSAQEVKQIPLTAEESVFVHAISEGDSMTNAYLRAFPFIEVSPREAYARARTLSLRPNVANAIVEMVDANRMWEGHTGKRIRLLISRQLEEIATTSPNDTARIAALRELAKLSHVKAYEEEVNTDEDALTPNEIIQEIEKRLSKVKKA